MKKRVLVFAPDSIHTKKFIDMIKNDVECLLVTNDPTQDYDAKTILMNRDIFMPFKAARIIRDFKPDFIHIHTINRVTMPVMMVAKNIPVILSAWGSSVLVLPKESFLMKKIVQFCLKRSDVITVDANIEKYVINGLIRDRKVIKNINFGAQKHDLGVSVTDKQNIIYSPRGHYDIYNIEKIIDSFVVFHKAHPQWKLYLAGQHDKVNTPYYKDKVAKLGLEDSVKFLGFISQEENAQHMANARIVVSIPFSDGKSHALMEAINANAICFVSDLPSNHELVTHNVNGFIVEDSDLIDFTTHEQIDLNFMQKYNEKISNGFSIEDNARKFVALYR